MNNAVIVSNCDDKFAIGLVAMLKSVSINSTLKHIDVYVLDGGISNDNKEKILDHFNNSNLAISFLQVNDEEVCGLKVLDFMSTTAYYRLLLPSVLSDSIDKVLYLDSDLVVEMDVTELFNIELSKSIAAVADIDKRAHYVSDSGGLRLYKELGIPAYNKNFNSGVLLINLKKWRQNDISKKILTYLSDNMESVLWMDQDGLNAVLWNDWLELPPTYNVSSILYKVPSWRESIFNEPAYIELYNNPKIIHYTHSKKPWHSDCIHPKKDRFFYYYNMIH